MAGEGIERRSGGGWGGLQYFKTAWLPDSEMGESKKQYQEANISRQKSHAAIIDFELCMCHSINIQSESNAMQRSLQLCA